MSTSLSALLIALIVLGYLVAPIALTWGWIRWIGARKDWRVWSVLSFIGFCNASLSAAVALLTVLYARFHPFPFYDPLLMKIYGLGAVLALAGLLLGISGVWRKNILRWHAPAAAFGMLAFWLIAISGE